MTGMLGGGPWSRGNAVALVGAVKRGAADSKIFPLGRETIEPHCSSFHDVRLFPPGSRLGWTGGPASRIRHAFYRGLHCNEFVLPPV